MPNLMNILKNLLAASDKGALPQKKGSDFHTTATSASTSSVLPGQCSTPSGSPKKISAANAILKALEDLSFKFNEIQNKRALLIANLAHELASCDKLAEDETLHEELERKVMALKQKYDTEVAKLFAPYDAMGNKIERQIASAPEGESLTEVLDKKETVFEKLDNLKKDVVFLGKLTVLYEKATGNPLFEDLAYSPEEQVYTGPVARV